jgi:hypothetical protein
LRNLPELQHDRFIHTIPDGYATHRCDAVGALAAELHVVLRFIPPSPTDLRQPLDRSVFGALKAEYRAIDRMDMSHKEDKRVTKADLAAHLILAWELVSDWATQRGWERYNSYTEALQAQLQDAFVQ